MCYNKLKRFVYTIIADLCLPCNGKEGAATVKIRWYEVLILVLALLCALTLLFAYFSTVWTTPSVTVERISVQSSTDTSGEEQEIQTGSQSASG